MWALFTHDPFSPLNREPVEAENISSSHPRLPPECGACTGAKRGVGVSEGKDSAPAACPARGPPTLLRAPGPPCHRPKLLGIPPQTHLA